MFASTTHHPVHPPPFDSQKPIALPTKQQQFKYELIWRTPLPMDKWGPKDLDTRQSLVPLHGSSNFCCFAIFRDFATLHVYTFVNTAFFVSWTYSALPLCLPFGGGLPSSPSPRSGWRRNRLEPHQWYLGKNASTSLKNPRDEHENLKECHRPKWIALELQLLSYWRIPLDASKAALPRQRTHMLKAIFRNCKIKFQFAITLLTPVDLCRSTK